MNRPAIVRLLRERLPSLLAVHAFGSRVQGTARHDSDLDLAVLVAGYADPLQLFDLSGELADLAGCPVDLVDLRAASSVLQHQILMHGQRWWAHDPQAGLFEAAALSEKMAFDAARAGLMADIDRSGVVHGR
jgi:predicted nucleotidyltransferase